MRRSGLAAGVVAVSLFALAWVAASAEAGGGAEVHKDLFREEGSFIFTNPCNGDKVSGTFTFLWVDHFIFDGSGRAHLSHHESLQNATAVGSVTGTTYRVIWGFTFNRNWDNDAGEPPPFEDSNSEVTQIIGRGPGNDFRARIRAHVTINANGNLTVALTTIETWCGGG